MKIFHFPGKTFNSQTLPQARICLPKFLEPLLLLPLLDCQLCFSVKVLKSGFSPGVKINWKQTAKKLHLLLEQIICTLNIENHWFY